MELEPDVQLGKLFIIIWMCGMLFVIILFIYVYLNARNEASDCEPKEIKNRNSEKSETKSDSPILKLIIVFLVITVVAVSTMNLTYKVNYFTKKANSIQLSSPPHGATAPLLTTTTIPQASAPPMENLDLNNSTYS
jgi:hypothetical protein